MYVRYCENSLSLNEITDIFLRLPMTDFQKIVSIINSATFQEIEQYRQSVDLLKLCQSKTHFDQRINGIYALWHSQYAFIYIGKGKPIFHRLKCHYLATQGKEKAPSWKQFFEHINTDIKVYWYEYDNPDVVIAEYCREALERLLQIKYEPLFEAVYPKGNRKAVPDLQDFLRKRGQGYIPLEPNMHDGSGK